MWLKTLYPILTLLSICECYLNRPKLNDHRNLTTNFIQNNGTCNHKNCISPNNQQQQQHIQLSTINHNYLLSSSVVYGLLELSSRDFLNEKCYSQMQMLYDAVHRKDVWAMKVLDSSGATQPGFIWGNNFWLGSITGCIAVQKPHPLTISDRFRRNMISNLIETKAPFDVEYKVIYVKHNSPWQIQVEFLLTEKVLHLGLCLPLSCNDSEIKNLTQHYLESSAFEANFMFENQLDVVHVKNLNVKTNFFQMKSFKIVGIFLLITLTMMGLAALSEHNSVDGKIDKDINENNSAHDLNYNQNIENKNCTCASEIEKSSLMRIVQCFSLKENIKSISNTNTPANAVPVINGLKSIGCFLVLIFHMNWFAHYTVHNPAMMFAYGERVIWQWVSTTPLIVDVFFTISGLLLSYNFLKNKSTFEQIRNNTLWANGKLFGKQLLHRYLRLSPLYLIIIGLTQISTKYLVETSPFRVHERYDEICEQNWWKNVFYIQNLFHVKDLCLNWTWSMACEMQFYILFTILLFVYAKNQKLAKQIFFGLFVIFAVLVYAIALRTKFTAAFDVLHELGTELYIAPWSRILPYLIGVGAGWIIYHLKGSLPLNQKSINLLWTLSTTITVMCHCSTVNRSISFYYAAPIITGIRIFYAISIAWWIIASATGHGGIFAKFLNLKVFVHVNKLSYGIYLLNPFVISVIYGLKDHSTHIDPITSSVMSIGVMVIVYILSIGFSLLFEIPYTKLSYVILKASKTKTK